MLVKTKFRFLFIVLILAAIIFTTCDSPMGMGQPIDWEAPVLTLAPVPNPYYVRLGSSLNGTVTDNIGVDRMIFINASTGEELFPVVREGDNWSISLDFTSDQNGLKIIGQVIAYDKAGNSGDTSMAFVTMIVDIRAPVVEQILIKRTDTKETALLKSAKLITLDGKINKDNLLDYQNGWFYIKGMVSDEDTKVNIISLEFYDIEKDINVAMISFDIDEGATPYYPVWTIKEEEVISAGIAKHGQEYYTNYYNNGAMYKYRVAIKALDMSENVNDTIVEDEGFVCFLADSDIPRGSIDPNTPTEVSKGTPFPVEFYDDDSLLWAYTGLLTEAQWLGTRAVQGTTADSGTKIPSDLSDNDKILWLKQKLTGSLGNSVGNGDGEIVYNWNFDRKDPGTPSLGFAGVPDKDKKILNLITVTGSLDEKLEYVKTSNSELDCGDYYLFTIVADKKLTPHDGAGPEWTNKDRWAGRVEKVTIKDDNAPLIVFDTTNGCPEENTFPNPLLGTPAENFNLVGYTLRENGGGADNHVKVFRLAWIPYGISGGPDSNITEVQNALKRTDFAGMPAGVQYWDFKIGNYGGAANSGIGTLIDAGDETIDNNKYRKQTFTKKFNVMGKADDVKPSTKNFIYNDPDMPENETKLFIFYALDSTGHEVFRQLRLLGLEDKPKLYIYDITNRVPNTSMPNGYPNPTLTGNFTVSTGAPTTSYYTLLNTYNDLNTVKTLLSGVSVTNGVAPDGDEAESYKIYPRETIVKFQMSAPQSGTVPIKSLTMKDITYVTDQDDPNQNRPVGSGISTLNTTTFCEYYPDVTQRTFLFEATDQLGNKTSIGRTIAISNAAQLDSISTTSQNGTYGHGKTITLTANFTSQIQVQNANGGPISSDGERPKLNVRYKMKTANTWVYDAIPCKGTYAELNTTRNSLDFDFVVPKDALLGVGANTEYLQTVYEGIPGSPTPPDSRPITIPGTTKIVSGDAPAFIPGYTSGTVALPNWTTAAKTLQGATTPPKKEIKLDGVHPVAAATTWAGGGTKTAYKPNEYYLKTNESIEVTIPADKPIRASGTSTLQYRIRDAGGTVHPGTNDYYRGNFSYLKPGSGYSLVYSLTVNATTCPYDGEIINVGLYTGAGGNIIDNAENTIEMSATDLNLVPTGTRIFIKKTAPAAPAAQFGGIAFASAPTNYNTTTSLTVTASSSTTPAPAPTPNNLWEDTIEYLDPNTSVWTTYTGAVSIGLNGSYTLQARYKDRAGNEGAIASKPIVMNNKFPNLVSVNAQQSNGTYTSGSLAFELNFASKVNITTGSNVKITLENRDATPTASKPAKNKIELTSPSIKANTNGTTIVFNWADVSGYEMWNGLFISSITLTGLTDDYGNTGKTGSGTYNDANNMLTGDATIATSKNLAKGLIVDGLKPSVSVRNPAHNVAPSGSTNYLTIVLTFDEPVMKGSGTITIKPSGTYAIPAVLEDSGYYLGTDGKRYATAGANRTYISSFYDIYNNSALNATDNSSTANPKPKFREYLLKGSSMSSHDLSVVTGQSIGPYKKMTHGLTEGPGYTGNYSGSDQGNGANSPNLGGSSAVTAMIPDTATKWVLDYQYGIRDNVTTVNNIRKALNEAKWRQQEIDVVSTSISNGTTSGTVTITLNEPLLKGLDWEVSYPAGTFTDMAGNPADDANGASTSNTAKNYYFTSPGIQPPVIRVNRRSYDGRTSDDRRTLGSYADAGTTTNWNTNSIAVTDSNGWGISSFNSVHYRVESETPGANVTAKVIQGAIGTGAARGDWTGSVKTANDGLSTGGTDRDWNTAAGATYVTRGTWVLPNIVRRTVSTTGTGANTQGTSQTYTVITKGGGSEQRESVGILRMFRSYNKDLTKTELDAVSSSDVSLSGGQGVIQYLDSSSNADPYKASKSYVIGTATKANNGDPVKGYEGVFRTVIMFNHSTSLKNNFLTVEGSNVKNGIPSIAGFPVRDADETDCRYLKVFNYVNSGTNYTRYYWVSTEIVSEWYFICWGGGRNPATANSTNNTLNGTHMSSGEVNNYLTVGYGDLTYSYNAQLSYGTTYY